MDCQLQTPLQPKMPRWERRKDARPQELLAAAMTIFVERGYASTRLEDVARAAGVSKGTLYLYYTNKEELFKAVVRQSIVPMLGDAALSVAAFEGSSEDLLRQVIQSWWDRIGATTASGISKLILAEADNFPELARFYQEEVMERGLRMMASMLQRGIDRGEFRAIDVEQTAQVLIAPLLMLSAWKHTVAPCARHDLQPEAFLSAFLNVTLHGLKLSK